MKYDEPPTDKDGWTQWVQPIRRGYKMSCCDCGLVHTLDFRVRGNRAQFRVRRNNRSTAMVRRWRKQNGKGLRRHT